MDALRQSIAAGRRTPAAEKASRSAEKAPAPKKGKKQVAGQREMLLPIEGKKTKEAKKPAASRPASSARRVSFRDCRRNATLSVPRWRRRSSI